MQLKKFDMTLAEARKYAEEPRAIMYLPESLSEELNNFGIYADDFELDGRLTMRVLYAYSFQSDEVAIAEIYSFDGAEFMLAEKYGDRTHWQTEYLNIDVFKQFVRHMSDLHVARKLQMVGDQPIQENFQLGGQGHLFNNYIAHSYDDQTVAVHLMSPKWSNFQWMFRDHVATYDGELVEFVCWADDRKSWEIREMEPDAILRFPDGTEREIEGWKVRFILKPQE